MWEKLHVPELTLNPYRHTDIICIHAGNERRCHMLKANIQTAGQPLINCIGNNLNPGIFFRTGLQDGGQLYLLTRHPQR